MRCFVFGWLLLIVGSCCAQCPGETTAIVDSGYSCAGDTLAIMASGSISQIVWYKDGQVVKTATANTIVSPVAIVAGGNGYGTAANQITGALQIAVDDNGYLYVPDEFNGRVLRFPPGSTSRTFGTTVAVAPRRQFQQYAGLCLDPTGNIYVSDVILEAVQRFVPGDTVGATVAGGHGEGAGTQQFMSPGSLSIDPAGNLFVCDAWNSRVEEWAPNASAGVIAAGGDGFSLPQPAGLALDDAGNLYISELWDSKVTRWVPGAASGVVVAGGNDSGAAANQLNYPAGICRDAAGNLYIADSHNNRIQKWAPGAAAGVTVAGGNGPGDGFDQLDDPLAVCLDKEGKLYIEDDDNHRILKLQQTIYTYIDSFLVAPAGGTYTAVVTIGGACSMSTAPIVIRSGINAGLSVHASINPVCGNDTVLFTAAVSGSGFTPVYRWSTGANPAADGSSASPATDSTPVFIEPHPADGEIVRCTVSDAPACVIRKMDSIVMTVNAVPAVVSGQEVSLAYGKSLTLAPVISGDIASYAWSPATGLSDTAIASPVADPLVTTTYNLRLTSPAGCTDSGTITVEVYTPLGIPNAFTPNGDGRNDVFYVLGGPAAMTIKDLVVFNRWGERVFEAKDAAAGDPAVGWNGTIHGSPAPAGSYVYILLVQMPGGRQETFKGTVMLIR